MFEIGGSRYEMSVVFDAMKADKMIANKSAAGYATRPMPNERLDRIRDVFCFCALTGLAFTDVDHLRIVHLDGAARLPVAPVKVVGGIRLLRNNLIQSAACGLRNRSGCPGRCTGR